MPTLFTISRPDQQTLIVGIMRLKNSGAAAANWNLMLAGATVALIPIFIVYAFCNKYFVDGLTAGAVKG
jgi:ABC-type glycerol-3-phosphate transport system permease component